jgi:hypothetical protein
MRASLKRLVLIRLALRLLSMGQQLDAASGNGP